MRISNRISSKLLVEKSGLFDEHFDVTRVAACGSNTGIAQEEIGRRLRVLPGIVACDIEYG